MTLSNAQFTRIRAVLEQAQVLQPQFRWRFVSEELFERDTCALLEWALTQMQRNPQEAEAIFDKMARQISPPGPIGKR